jgi:alpha-D-ribose 1-methylphosphonate 5-triphosphate synthase subunit PhnG
MKEQEGVLRGQPCMRRILMSRLIGRGQAYLAEFTVCCTTIKLTHLTDEGGTEWIQPTNTHAQTPSAPDEG